MSTLTTIKRLAADILDIGRNRVRIRTELSEGEQKQLMEAITRTNIRDLIKDKIIYAKEKKGKRKKNRKRKRTTGRKRGKVNATISGKDRWMIKIRALRRYLNKLINEGELGKEHKRSIYLKIKGNSFRNKGAMYAYLKDNKLLSEKAKSVEKEKTVKRTAETKEAIEAGGAQ